jgi:hypothetical protein
MVIRHTRFTGRPVPYLLRRMSPVVAQNGPADAVAACPLLG